MWPVVLWINLIIVFAIVGRDRDIIIVCTLVDIDGTSYHLWHNCLYQATVNIWEYVNPDQGRPIITICAILDQGWHLGHCWSWWNTRALCHLWSHWSRDRTLSLSVESLIKTKPLSSLWWHCCLLSNLHLQWDLGRIQIISELDWGIIIIIRWSRLTHPRLWRHWPEQTISINCDDPPEYQTVLCDMFGNGSSMPSLNKLFYTINLIPIV